MERIEHINEFYMSIPENVNIFSDNKEKGQFNVFSRWRCRGTFIRRDFYKIALVIGSGVLKYADQKLIINKPTLFFTNPLIPYSWEPVSEEQEGWICVFTEEFIQREQAIIEQIYPVFNLNKPIFLLEKESQKTISDLFKKMIQEISSDYEYKYDVLYGYLKLLIHEAQKQSPEIIMKHQYTNASQRITHNFLEILEKQFPIDSPEMPLKVRKPQDYAKILSIHVNHLNHSIKEITGKTSSGIILDRITQEAIALLKNTDWNISDIAYALGFEYPSHFTGFFRKQTGVTPKSIRIS